MITIHIRKYISYFNTLSLFTKVFFGGFVLCVTLEGIGIIPKEVLFVLFLLFSIILGSYSHDEQVYGKNKKIFVFALVYLIYLFVVSFFSLNIQTSFEQTIFLLSLFCIYIVSIPLWKEIHTKLLYVLLGLGIFFCFYSVLLSILLKMGVGMLLPYSGYQYVYTSFGSNHLGEFLVFPMIISFSFYIQQRNKKFLYLFMFYFFFFLFSYSRAAYIGFTIGFFLLLLNLHKQFSSQQKKLASIVLLLSVLSILIIFSLSRMQEKIPSVAGFIQSNPKSLTQTREAYVIQGLQGFLQYRYYGAGLGNFQYVSQMFRKTPVEFTTSSHNIFIDMMSETGIFSFVVFLLFMIMLLKTIKKNHHSIYAVLLLCWLVMVQFDYIHQMYSYLLLFSIFLIGVQRYNPVNNEIPSKVLQKSLHFVLFPLLSLFLIVYFVSWMFIFTDNVELARYIYPLQKEAYSPFYAGKDHLHTYVRLFSGEYLGWYILGEQNESIGNIPEAISDYEKSFWANPFANLSFAEYIYDLKKKYSGNGSPRWFADRLFMMLHTSEGLPKEQSIFISTFCQKVYNFHCPYSLR